MKTFINHVESTLLKPSNLRRDFVGFFYYLNMSMFRCFFGLLLYKRKLFETGLRKRRRKAGAERAMVEQLCSKTCSNHSGSLKFRHSHHECLVVLQSPRTANARIAFVRLEADIVSCSWDVVKELTPQGPSSPYLWFSIPSKSLKSYNKVYLDPQFRISGAFCPRCRYACLSDQLSGELAVCLYIMYHYHLSISLFVCVQQSIYAHTYLRQVYMYTHAHTHTIRSEFRFCR